MSIEHHDIHHEFPEYNEKISELKTSNAHFLKLYDEYHETDLEIRKIEEQIEVASDENLDKLKTHRVYLKDEIYKMLVQK